MKRHADHQPGSWEEPAGPPPTMATSKSSIATQSREKRAAIKSFQSSYRSNGILHYSNPPPPTPYPVLARDLKV